MARAQPKTHRGDLVGGQGRAVGRLAGSLLLRARGARCSRRLAADGLAALPATVCDQGATAGASATLLTSNDGGAHGHLPHKLMLIPS